MKNQKGSVLVSVLLMLVVLTILSIAVYNISYSANRQAQFTRDNGQAYYLAKAGADLVIENIEEIIDRKQNNFEIEFPNEGKASIKLELGNDNKDITIHSTGIVNDGKRNESKSKIKADLKINSNSADVVILGVDSSGNIYKIDKEFELKKEINPEPKVPKPKKFAWNGKFGNESRIVLVGTEQDDTMELKSTKTLISNDGEDWKKVQNKNKDENEIKGFNFVVWSEQENTFYATSINKSNSQKNKSDKNKSDKNKSDKNKPAKVENVYYLDMKKEGGKPNWEKFNGFKGIYIEKLAQGNDTIVGISNNEDYRIIVGMYEKENNKGNFERITNQEKNNEKYNAIVFGGGKREEKFVIVGSKNSDGPESPLILCSEKGVYWKKPEEIISNTVLPKEALNDVTWTGKKFVAVGNNETILTSDNGIVWKLVPSENITPIPGPINSITNYSIVSGCGDYIIAYSQDKNIIIISKDGGKNWTEKRNSEIPILEDIIVISKGDGNIGPKADVHWSK